MSRSSPESPNLTPRELAARVDATCDRFEAAWIAGNRPRIEDHLHDVSEPGLGGLLRELILLEVTYRRRSGETPTREEYLARFPRRLRGLNAVFPEAPPPQVGRSVGPYRAEERLGAGSMGEVYRAHDSALGRDVALKLLPPGFSASTRARLLCEAWAGARVQHPGIATFYDAGEAGGIDYIAMEYVRGRTLREVLRDGALPPERALAIAAGLLEALAHAHAAGILHRDIKPENIMVTGERSAKLLDLGLAKGAFDLAPDRPDRKDRSASSSFDEGPVAEPGLTTLAPETVAVPTRAGLDGLTVPGAVLGTPGYMAPEQIWGEMVDVRADLFAAGVVLHEMITGKRLFDGASIPARLNATLSREVPPLSGPGLPTGLDVVVAKAMARDPAARWPSAGGFLAELQRLHPRERRADRTEALAILDFQDGLDDPPDAWIGGSLADDLAIALGRVAGLRVIPRQKVLAVRAAIGPPDQVVSIVELGVRLGASLILIGSFRGRGQEQRVRARLIDPATGATDWEDEFYGTPDRIFEVRDRVAEAVTATLGLAMPGPGSRPAAPSKTEAYRCLSRGRRLWWERFARGRIEEARAWVERAVELEPDYALALAVLAEVQAFRANISNDPHLFETAIATARRAIATDPDLAEAHIWLGYAQLHLGRSLEASRALRRARELDPGNSLAHYFGGVALRGSFRREETRVLRDALAGQHGARTRTAGGGSRPWSASDAPSSSCRNMPISGCSRDSSTWTKGAWSRLGGASRSPSGSNRLASRPSPERLSCWPSACAARGSRPRPACSAWPVWRP